MFPDMRFSAYSFCRHRPRQIGRCVAVVVVGVWGVGFGTAGDRIDPWAFPGMVSSAGAASLPDAQGLPPLVRTNNRSFTIPFRLPESQDPAADAATQRVILNVSKDLGSTWAAAGETAPTAGSFTYMAELDGEYWFRLRAVDRKGRSRGGEGPDIRVLVDAAGPRLAARLWKGPDGEIVCRYAATDGSLRLDSLVLEYRGQEDRGWKSVAADAVLARESPAHLVGEAIWWAGEKVEQLSVRIAISDEAGNQTVRQFPLEPSDPRVDQATLAQELGVPPLPGQSDDNSDALRGNDGGGLEADRDLALTAPATVSAGPGTDAGAIGSVLTREGGSGWPAESAAWNDRPAAAGSRTAANRQGSTRNVTAQPRNRTASAASLLPRADDTPPRHGVARPASAPVDPLAAAGITQPAVDGQPLAYRNRPLHLARSRRFAWDYEIPANRRAAGPLRAELWTTRDGGVTWQKAAIDNDGKSPIDVELSAAGFYGVRLELVADVPDAEAGPRSGAEPDAWVGVDEEPPQVELVGIDRDESEATDALLIRYSARDPLLASNAVRLTYSPNAEGPWATIITGIANEGVHRWEPGRNVPARVFIRIEATDAAGNEATASSDEAISVAPTRFGGRLGGLRVISTP
jgi:hypothetical protein